MLHLQSSSKELEKRVLPQTELRINATTFHCKLKYVLSSFPPRSSKQ